MYPLFVTHQFVCQTLSSSFRNTNVKYKKTYIYRVLKHLNATLYQAEIKDKKFAKPNKTQQFKIFRPLNIGCIPYNCRLRIFQKYLQTLVDQHFFVPRREVYQSRFAFKLNVTICIMKNQWHSMFAHFVRDGSMGKQLILTPLPFRCTLCKDFALYMS